MAGVSFGFPIRPAVAAAPPPNTLGGGTLLEWYKADAVTGVSDGADIPQANLVDQSGNSHNFTSKTGNGAKLRVGTGPNSTNWLDFTLGGGYAGPSVAAPAGDFTFFAVLKTPSSAIQSLIGSVGNGGAQLRLNAYKIELDRDAVAQVGISTNLLTTATWTVLIVTYTKATGSIFIRIGSVTQTISGTSGVTFTSPGGVNLFNYQATAVNNFLGGCTELCRWTSVLPGGDLTSLYSYATAKYAL